MEAGAGAAGEHAAGFGQDEVGGGVVPRLDAVFEEELTQAAGHVAELDGAGAEAPDVVAFLIGFPDDGAAGLCVLLMIEAERRDQHALVEGPVGDVDGLPVQA